MKSDIDPLLVAAFGSETRVRILAVLAGASRPMTAYRVGKTGDVPLPKAYQEIARLAGKGLLVRKGSGWVLLDNDMRTLLQRRVRIAWVDDWSVGKSERAGRVKELAAGTRTWFDGSRYKPNPAIASRFAKEFERPPEKDRILARMGLSTSRKSG